MCEIFGASLKSEKCLNGYLKEFFRHSSEHPHGWGLAVSDGHGISIEKEPVQASKSGYLKCRLQQPVITNIALAHIRYATIGNVEYRNCHPYSKCDNFSKRWTLIHNGTIFDFEPLNRFVRQQCGDTDSERILLYIVECVNQRQKFLKRPLYSKERFSLLENIVSEMSKGNKLNLLIYDGEYIYAHCNYKDSLHYLETDNGVLFSTRPLDKDNWQTVPFTRLLAFKNGQLSFQGTEHHHEYTDNADTMKYLYQIFSNL